MVSLVGPELGRGCGFAVRGVFLGTALGKLYLGLPSSLRRVHFQLKYITKLIKVIHKLLSNKILFVRINPISSQLVKGVVADGFGGFLFIPDSFLFGWLCFGGLGLGGFRALALDILWLDAGGFGQLLTD